MHAISALEKGSKGRIWEVVLHLEQVDKLWHASTLLNDLFKVEVWVLDEFVDGFLISEDTILVRLTVLKDTQVGLAGHQQTLLDDVHEAEAQEIQGNVHEVGCGKRHESQNAHLVTDDLGLYIL